VETPNNGGANGHAADESPVEVMRIVHDPRTGNFTVEGLSLGPVKCLGMLEYAAIMVKRVDALDQAQAMAAAAPRIAVPGGRL
jgi:hypothetical protein